MRQNPRALNTVLIVRNHVGLAIVGATSIGLTFVAGTASGQEREPIKRYKSAHFVGECPPRGAKAVIADCPSFEAKIPEHLQALEKALAWMAQIKAPAPKLNKVDDIYRFTYIDKSDDQNLGGGY